MVQKKKAKTTGKKKTSKGKKLTAAKQRSSLKSTMILVSIAIIAIFVTYIYVKTKPSPEPTQVQMPSIPTICIKVEENYGLAIDSCARILGIPASYAKALACLECSGRTDMPKRYEPHVYKRLLKVQKGQIKEYEGIRHSHIADANDEALRNLATSWGPFQIMGYKCLHLDILVANLRGDNAVYWGMKWISMEYGNLLKNKRYKDAFHYHNAGCVYPSNGKAKTYDPDYVKRGLEYMEVFDQMSNSR